jgi:IS5 family transposase
LQQWFALSDPAVEDALYEPPVVRRFVGIDLDRAPAINSPGRSPRICSAFVN